MGKQTISQRKALAMGKKTSQGKSPVKGMRAGGAVKKPKRMMGGGAVKKTGAKRMRGGGMVKKTGVKRFSEGGSVNLGRASSRHAGEKGIAPVDKYETSMLADMAKVYVGYKIGTAMSNKEKKQKKGKKD